MNEMRTSVDYIIDICLKHNKDYSKACAAFSHYVVQGFTYPQSAHMALEEQLNGAEDMLIKAVRADIDKLIKERFNHD